jgi:hypothetical protein
MSNPVATPFTQETRVTLLNAVNIWLTKQEDYLKDFIFTDMKPIEGAWHFETKPCTELPVESDMQILTDRMCKDFGYKVLR